MQDMFQAKVVASEWQGEQYYNPDKGTNIPPRTYNPVVLLAERSDTDGDHPSSRSGGHTGVTTDDDGGKAEEGEKRVKDDNKVEPMENNALAIRIESMQWGLIPHWMKRQPDYATALKTINARDDTILWVVTTCDLPEAWC